MVKSLRDTRGGTHRTSSKIPLPGITVCDCSLQLIIFVDKIRSRPGYGGLGLPSSMFGRSVPPGLLAAALLAITLLAASGPVSTLQPPSTLF